MPYLFVTIAKENRQMTIEINFNNQELKMIEKAIRFYMEHNQNMTDENYAELSDIADTFRDNQE
jgi:prephenate dehydrogenase